MPTLFLCVLAGGGLMSLPVLPSSRVSLQVLACAPALMLEGSPPARCTELREAPPPFSPTGTLTRAGCSSLAQAAGTSIDTWNGSPSCSSPSLDPSEQPSSPLRFQGPLRHGTCHL